MVVSQLTMGHHHFPAISYFPAWPSLVLVFNVVHINFSFGDIPYSILLSGLLILKISWQSVKGFQNF